MTDDNDESEQPPAAPPRRLGKLTWLLLAIGLAAAAALFWQWLNAPDAGLPGYYTDNTPPWLSGDDGERWTVSGTVVTPEGEPIAGATVKLIYPGDPHWPESLAYETTTDGTGGFEIETVHYWFSVVVEHDGASRGYRPPWDGGIYDEHDAPPAPMTITIAPMTRLPIHLSCTEAELSGFHRVSIYWRPDDDLIHSDFFDLPSRSRSVANLPTGQFTAVAAGPCGTDALTLEVGSADPPALSFTLPPESHGELIVRMARDRPDTVRLPQIYFHGLKVNDWEEVRVGRRLRLTHLAPGPYELRETACREPVDIVASSVTTVTIAPGRCDTRVAAVQPAEDE